MSHAAPGPETPASKRRRLRLPVTLLSLILGAWLLPAFTRQWNDRQSAHTVKAGIVSDMTAATARVLQDGGALWASLPSCIHQSHPIINVLNWSDYAQFPHAHPEQKLSPQDRKCFARASRELANISARIDRRWSLASSEVEARMRAYLNPQVVAAWQVFSWLMGVYDGSAEGTPEGTHGELELTAASHNGLLDLQPAATRSVGAALGADQYEDIAAYFHDTFDPRDPRVSHLLHTIQMVYPGLERFPLAGGHPVPLSLAFARTEFALLGLEQEIAREVLDSHVTGYSTTTHDLIHDLIP